MEGGVERPAGELRLKENRKRKIPARTRDKDSKQRLVSWLRSLTMCTGNHQRQHQKLGQKKESANRKEGKGRILRDVELLPLSEIQQIQAPFNLKVLNEPDELIPRDVKPPIPPRKPLQKGKCNLFSSISELLQQNVSWYWGALTLEEAERLLEGRGEGCFLVRDSTSLTCVFSIAVKIDPAKRPVHIRIEYVNGEFRLQCSQYSAAESVVALINKTVHLMRKGNFCFIKQRRPGVLPQAITLLSSSVGRNEAVPSLKYLSRLKVRQSVGSSAHLDVLPLPRTLSDYVKKCPFYDPDLVNAVINNACVTKISNMHDDVISLDHMIDDDGDLER